MRKTPFAIAAVLCLAVAAGAAVFVLRGGPPGPAPELRHESVTVANVGVYSLLNPIARDKGFFDERALDVHINEYDSGATSMSALRNGNADLAVAADFVGVRNMFDAPDLVVLAQLSSQNSFRLVVRTDRGIVRPGDLRGKRVGVTRRTAGEFYLGTFLAANGMSRDDVTMIDLSPPGMRAELADGNVDAVLIFEPNAFEFAQQFGATVRTWPAQGEQRALALLYGTRAFVENHPEAVRRYLDALKEANAFVREQPAAAKEIVGRRLSLSTEFLEYFWPQLTPTLTLNQGMLLTMQDQARWMLAEKIVTAPAAPDIEAFIDLGPLSSVDPAAVTLTR